MKRRLLSLLLALVLVLGMLPAVAFAAPAQSSGVYQIGTAEDLLWFAQQVNGGQTKLSGVLTADIDLSSTANWPGIGSSDYRFAGSFDGQGHTVTFQDADWGLFGFVRGSEGAVATVKNVRTKGSIHASGIAHEASYAYFENCINGATITANQARTAGVVGFSSGVQQGNGTTANDVLIVNCGNEASVTGLSSVGGILGWAQVNTRVENCCNTGNINGKEAVGGIAGFLQASFRGETYVKNSYNTGTVTGTRYVAGIVGDAMNTVTITNTYNAGKAHYAIAGNVYNTTVKITNCYFLGTASAKSSPDFTWYTEEEVTTGAAAKTAPEMATSEFANLLGSAFKQSCPAPVLSYQTASGHSGSPCDKCHYGSTVKEVYDVTFQEHEGFVLEGEAKATQGSGYSFTLTINEGYEAASGFTVKVNGEVITPASNGKYTVASVTGPISVTVLNV